MDPGCLSGIAPGYVLDDRGSIPNGAPGIFLFDTMSRPDLGPTQHPNQWVDRDYFLGDKSAGV
jgi:hypothetical protein